MPKIRDFNRVTALYERLSKDDEQQGESNSILNQKRFLEDFARKSGMTNIKHFTDDGYTGRNFNRPGFQAMLAEAEAGKIGTIIVKDMSRFGRNYLEVGFYTEILFPKKQIRFIAINNSVDSDKPQDMGGKQIIPHHSRKMVHFPLVCRDFTVKQEAHHLFTGDALHFSYLSERFVHILQQSYALGFLIAACLLGRHHRYVPKSAYCLHPQVSY